MGHLLVIEDDPDLAFLLKETLEAFGHDVSVAHTATGVVDLVADTNCDALLIDLGLPDCDGKDALCSVRAVSDLPIIVVTARSKIEERVAALDAGADDYVIKPFSNDELAARVRAQLRRAGASSEGPRTLRFEGLEIDPLAKQVRLNGDLIHFTPTELQLLVYLGHNPNRLLTHRQLYRQVWPDGSAESGHYVRVYIQQIRQKLGDDASDPTFIATELSSGYRWLPRPVALANRTS